MMLSNHAHVISKNVQRLFRLISLKCFSTWDFFLIEMHEQIGQGIPFLRIIIYFNLQNYLSFLKILNFGF